MFRDERLNGYTHLVGALLALAACVALILKAATVGDGWKIIGAATFGSTLLLLYVVSTLYHGLADGTAKRVFGKLDHLAIYLLIAGTYTPFLLVTLNGLWGWRLFGIVWALAAAGILLDLLHRSGLRWAQIVIYLVMGWIVVVAWPQLNAALAPAGVAWLVAGGVIYTLGTIFFGIGKRWPHAHGIWHLFVLGGSTCHFIAVYGYVI